MGRAEGYSLTTLWKPGLFGIGLMRQRRATRLRRAATRSIAVAATATKTATTAGATATTTATEAASTAAATRATTATTATKAATAGLLGTCLVDREVAAVKAFAVEGGNGGLCFLV